MRKATAANAVSPTYLLPASVTQTCGVTGLSKLYPTVNGAPSATCDQRTLKVYPDHLARDMDNFSPVLGRSCLRGNWTTLFGAVRMTNWNCHGSVQHAYDGTGIGYIIPGPPPCISNWPASRFDYPFNADATNAVHNMKRGDVVVYYGRPSGGAPVLHHSAVSLGGSLTWGANNGKLKQYQVLPGTPPIWWESWEWNTQTVFEAMEDHNNDPFRAALRYDFIEIGTKP